MRGPDQPFFILLLDPVRIRTRAMRSRLLMRVDISGDLHIKCKRCKVANIINL